MTLQLEKEYKIYQKYLSRWLTYHSGEFVLIKEKEVVGFFQSYEDALRAGLLKFGNVPFFIKAVQEKKEKIHIFCSGLK